MKGGAQLSRALVQLLHLLHNDSILTGQHETRWGLGLSFDAYLAVLCKGKELYGSISFRAGDLDDCLFDRLVTDAEMRDRDVANAMAALMERSHYMPLPLSLSKISIDDGGIAIAVERVEAQTVEAALLRAPNLAPLMLNNGKLIKAAVRCGVVPILTHTSYSQATRLTCKDHCGSAGASSQAV